MVTGASRAEAALMVIDAARGVEENTRRHGYFLSMLGIRQVAVLVNKMDLGRLLRGGLPLHRHGIHRISRQNQHLARGVHPRERHGGR